MGGGIGAWRQRNGQIDRRTKNLTEKYLLKNTNNRFRSRGIKSEVPIGRRWHDKHPFYPNVQVHLIVESVH